MRTIENRTFKNVLIPALIAALLLILALPANAEQAREIVVGPGEEVTTITAALGLAEDGDRILVRSGTYREGEVVVDRSVTIVGEGRPVIDGEGEGGVMRVTADGVEIRGLLIRGSQSSHVRDHAALRVDGASNCLIEDNVFEDNFFGIYLARGEGCRIRGNELRATAARQSEAANGIHAWNANRIIIERNLIRGHRDGIYLEHVTGARVRDNVSEQNLRYGLHFMFSDDTHYERNTFRNNAAGVAVMFTQNVVIRDNLFIDNWGTAAYGLLIKDIRDSRIEGNIFRRNTVALHSDGADRVAIEGNLFVRNGWAVKIMASSQENVFTGNDFVDNSFDVTTNSRRNYNTFVGNFWSRYKGYDLTGDGIGDVPHRPVRLFALLVERHPSALILLRSLFVDILDVAERVIPVLTPETLVDDEPRMRGMTT